jgi:hypothetical protein
MKQEEQQEVEQARLLPGSRTEGKPLNRPAWMHRI